MSMPAHYTNEVLQDATAFVINDRTGKAPASAAAQRRLFFNCFVICATCSAAFHYSNIPWIQVGALGLIVPGGAFLSHFDLTHIGLFVLTLILCPVSFIAWIGSGALAVPLCLYISAAALGAHMTQTNHISVNSLYAALGIHVFVWVYCYSEGLKHSSKSKELRAKRNEIIQQNLSKYTNRKHIPLDERELDIKTLRCIQYFIELGLQDFDNWDGHDDLDQFQTASLRYQLYNIVYSLGCYQTIYAPSARGAISAAQRNAIEKSLTEKVMGYWKWESLLGHFTLDWDPIKWDNIMVSGYLQKALGIYTGATGDMRYTKPGSLVFNISKNAKYEYDMNSINQCLLKNWKREKKLYGNACFPCEPNWTYTVCNLFGCSGAITYDQVTGGNGFEEVREDIKKGIHEEMSDEAGTLLVLKSSYTGLPLPVRSLTFDSFSAMDLNILDPISALRSWIIAKDEAMRYDKEKGEWVMTGVIGAEYTDFGNYSKSPVAPQSQFAQMAAELGDEEVRVNLLKQIDEALPLEKTKSGGLRHPGMSIWFAGSVLQARLCRYRDWTYTITHGAARQCWTGPVLGEYDWINVMVARAYSKDGTDLDLVLYNGKQPGTFNLKLNQLVVNQKYKISTGGSFIADIEGNAVIPAKLDGRTHIYISQVPEKNAVASAIKA